MRRPSSATGARREQQTHRNGGDRAFFVLVCGREEEGVRTARLGRVRRRHGWQVDQGQVRAAGSREVRRLPMATASATVWTNAGTLFRKCGRAGVRGEGEEGIRGGGPHHVVGAPCAGTQASEQDYGHGCGEWGAAHAAPRRDRRARGGGRPASLGQSARPLCAVTRARAVPRCGTSRTESAAKELRRRRSSIWSVRRSAAESAFSPGRTRRAGRGRGSGRAMTGWERAAGKLGSTRGTGREGGGHRSLHFRGSYSSAEPGLLPNAGAMQALG